MLVFKSNKILWVIGEDNMVLLRNTTEQRFDLLRQTLYKKYGSVYGLEEVKREIINL